MYEKYGYDLSRFVDENEINLKEFECGICLGVVNNPIETKCCRQTFCKFCINQWFVNNNTCPYDRALIGKNDLIESSKIVVNLMSKFRIKCDNSENGCQVVVGLGSLNSHLNECKFGIIAAEKARMIREQLVLIIHAKKCFNSGKSCDYPNCEKIKPVINHMKECKFDKSCAVGLCRSSRKILNHWKSCKNIECIVCKPVNISGNFPKRKRKNELELLEN